MTHPERFTPLGNAPPLPSPRSAPSSSVPPTARSHAAETPQSPPAETDPPGSVPTQLLEAILETNMKAQEKMLQSFFASLRTGQALESPPTAESRAIDRLGMGVKETSDVVLGMRGEIQNLSQLISHQMRAVRSRSTLPLVATGLVLVLLQAAMSAISAAVAIAALTDRTVWEVLRAVLLS